MAQENERNFISCGIVIAFFIEHYNVDFYQLQTSLLLLSKILLQDIEL
jgi:hypothetical protein